MFGRLQEAMAANGTQVLLLGHGADLAHLTGCHGEPAERLTMLVVPAVGTATLVVPALEAPRARALGADDGCTLIAWQESEDPIAIVAGLVGSARTIAVQDRLWTTFTLGLQAAVPDVSWQIASSVMRDLRQRKSASEVAGLARVGAAIDAVHAQVSGLLRPGRTEQEVGEDIARLILEEHDKVNFVIVASGPNGASPHHETSSRVIVDGDPVVVDIGGTMDGWCSDVTRNYVVGTPPPGYREIHDLVDRARAAAMAQVRPGVTAASVDAAARRVIEEAGHGDAFLHRTGHGIGREEHEEPWIIAGNEDLLEPGMTFSIEPGIYLEGRFGVRIEDIVAVTEDGVTNLTSRPHQFTTTGEQH